MGDKSRLRPGLAKTSQPRPVKVYPRVRLFRRLDIACKRPVVWIAGPPGAGKTTLITSYLAARGRTALWYQLDRGDDDVATFFHYLGLADPRFGRTRRLPHLTHEYRADLETFTRRFFEQLYFSLQIPFTVVLDNYHVIPAESELHRVLPWALGVLPEVGCVMIASRGDPPNSLGRLESNRAVSFVRPDDLRLRLNEAKGIARLWRSWERGMHLVPALHRRTDGWTAGLVLALEQGAPDTSKRDVAETSRNNRFRYFGGEILAGMDPATRDVLLKTALLPTMTRDTVRMLTGNEQAGRIVAGMHKRNYFTEKLAGSEPMYRYHPLFREYLLAEGDETFGVDEMAALRRQAAELLERSGRLEEAAELVHGNRDPENLARLCLRLSHELLAQGRNETLLKWLSAIPDGERATDPWIEYWLGRSLLPLDPQGAAKHFEKAHGGFELVDDTEGRLSAQAGVIESIRLSWRDFTQLDPWIARIEEFDERHGKYPSRRIETDVAVVMFGALMLRRPEHSKIRYWADRSLRLARESGDPVLLIRAIEHLSLYFNWTGDFDEAGKLLRESSRLLSDPEVPPIVILGNKLQEAVLGWNIGEFDRSLAAVEEGLVLGRRCGVSLYRNRLLVQGVYASAGSGDLDNAGRYLTAFAEILDTRQRLSACQYHHLSGWIALLHGDTDAALTSTRRATETAEELGGPFPVALLGLNLARALHARGKQTEARRHIGISHSIGKAIGSDVLVCISTLISADFDLAGGDSESCSDALRRGLGIARRRNYFVLPCWDPALVSRLCGFALDNGIETVFSRELIRQHRLLPSMAGSPAWTKWPWPIRIRTLGNFEVELDGTPLGFKRNAHRKKLDFLRVLIALGGVDVNERNLADTLWPDAEGDAALQSLATTLHRVRKLLGLDHALHRREGRVSLNTKLCWVDTLAFDDMLVHAANSIGDKSKREWFERALNIYNGPFLAQYSDIACSAPTRERLETRFVATIKDLAESSAARGDFEVAMAWYQRGIELAPAVESLYRGLIRLSLHHGETAAAALAYRRCERTLKAVTGLAPSAKTRELVTAFIPPVRN